MANLWNGSMGFYWKDINSFFFFNLKMSSHLLFSILSLHYFYICIVWIPQLWWKWHRWWGHEWKLDLFSNHYWRTFSSVQLLCCIQLFVTPWTSALQASLFITNSQSLLKLMPTESVMSSNNLIICHPLLLLPSIFPSIRVFSNESALHIRWPKYWRFSFSISPSNEHPGLISLRMDWLDLLAVQGTLKSLLQHHSSKASVLQCSAFFIVQFKGS